MSRIKTILITRPKEDAKALAAVLAAKGFRSLIEPVIAIEGINETVALNPKPQAILLTSKHAAAALAKMTNLRRVPIIAVGEATAEAADRLGFKPISIAGGTARTLIAFVRKHYTPTQGYLLYARGAEISTDIARELARYGFAVKSVTLYRVKAAQQLSVDLRKKLTDGQIDAVLFFSQRTAETYVTLALKYDLGKAHRAISTVCMSRDIARKLRPLPWKKIFIAARPNTKSMLNKVNSL